MWDAFKVIFGGKFIALNIYMVRTKDLENAPASYQPTETTLLGPVVTKELSFYRPMVNIVNYLAQLAPT